MGHGAYQDKTARGERTVWFAEALESVIENFLQLPKLTVFHPYDDGTVSVTCRGEDGRERLVRQKDDDRQAFPYTFSE
jgi:hypothetical protein